MASTWSADVALLRAAVRRGVLTNQLEGDPFSADGSGDDLVNLETETQFVASSTDQFDGTVDKVTFEVLEPDPGP